MKRLFIAIAALLLLFLLVMPTGRNIWKAAFVIPNLIPGNHLRPLEEVSAAPKLLSRDVPYKDGVLKSDLYMPQDGRFKEVALIVTGASAMGKNDPRIINLSQTMARAGMAVLVPDFPDITIQKFTLSSVDEVLSAYAYLVSNFPDKTKGIMSFSVGTGPMFIAASNEKISDKVDFLISFGGFYDLKNVLRSATTETHQDISEIEEIRQQFLNSFGHNLAFEQLLQNRDPAKFDQLYGKLSPEIKNFIENSSPAGYLKDVKTRKIFLVHSNPDYDVPTSESLKLKAALGERASLTILKSFSHTDVALLPITPKSLVVFYVPEVWKFYKLIFDILNQ